MGCSRAACLPEDYLIPRAWLNHGGKGTNRNWSRIVFNILMFRREFIGFLFFDLWLLNLTTLACDLFLNKAFGGEIHCFLCLPLNHYQNVQRIVSNILEEPSCLNYHQGATTVWGILWHICFWKIPFTILVSSSRTKFVSKNMSH